MSRTPERIAVIAGRMNGGGVESVLMNYYRNMDRERFQYDFYVSSDSRKVPVDEIDHLGGRIYEVPSYLSAFDYLHSLQSALEKRNYLIVHSHVNTLSVLPLAVAKRCGIPIRIAHSHSTGGPGEPVAMTVKNALRIFSCKYSTVRLACSDAAGSWLFGPKGNYELVYNAINLNEYEFNETVRMEVRKRLGIRQDTFVVGHAGRFVPVKNHDKVIEVFSYFHQLKPNSKLVLVGDGPLLEKFKRKNERSVLRNAIQFLGHRSDIHELYQAFDAFILPSKYEGLGLVGVEAQAAGLPCLFSEGITKEVRLTDNVEFLPLSQPKLWSTALLKVGERRSANDLRLNEYNITSAVRHLENIYARELRKQCVL